MNTKHDNPWYKVLTSKEFWVFFGTGLIVSVAYIDPGNWGTDIQAGSSFNYSLLWIVWLSSGMAMLFQYLSGKLGITGKSLAEVIKERWKNKKLIMIYWIFSEIAIIATDLAEFLGIVIALNLLFNIPLIIGAIISILDVVLLIILTKNNFRILEQAFIVFVSTIGLGYVYELFLVKPNFTSILTNSITPILHGDMILVAVGIIGATVMPHALFVHSWLIKNKIKENSKITRKKALKFHTADVVISLTIAGLINAAILIMAAAAFYSSHSDVTTMTQAYKTLTPLFGSLASIVFAVALLASGISSSITGTLAGQSIMESLTDFKISSTLRRIITRVINIIPIAIAVILKIEPLQILVYSQVALSFLIPLPLIPLIYYTAKKDVMGDLINSKRSTITAIIFATIILAFNAYLIYSLF
ncbi:Divalent metal cation transporter MntH [uncultured archaeon]|nr:Divalent metal cation transporter MntH [uncultured archaeon]